MITANRSQMPPRRTSDGGFSVLDGQQLRLRTALPLAAGGVCVCVCVRVCVCMFGCEYVFVFVCVFVVFTLPCIVF
jgi:hypothetical protein